jgi:predicted ATPase
VLFVVEDAHWIDPTTAELIELVLDRLANCAALVLITARPNFELPLAAHPAVNKILLDRIEREAGEEIIDRIAERQALPREIVGEILDKADGVPLFIEELSRAVLESGRLKEADADHTSAGRIRLGGTLIAS